MNSYENKINQNFANPYSYSYSFENKGSLPNMKFQNQYNHQVVLNSGQILRNQKVLHNQSSIFQSMAATPAGGSTIYQQENNKITPYFKTNKSAAYFQEEEEKKQLEEMKKKRQEFQYYIDVNDPYGKRKKKEEIQILAQKGDFDVLVNHQSLMQDKNLKNFTNSSLSQIIEDFYPRIIGNKEILFRIDLVSNLPLEFVKLELQIGFMLKIGEERQSIFKMKHMRTVGTKMDDIHSRVANIYYKDKLNLVKNPDMFLYFEINGILAETGKRRKYMWTIQPLFDARGNIIYGKFIIPFYSFSQTVTTKLHLSLADRFKPQMYMWIADGENKQFQKNTVVPRNQFYMGQLHSLIQKQQNISSAIDIPRILHFSDDLATRILNAKVYSKDKEEISALRNQILGKIDQKIHQLQSLDKFDLKLKKGLDKIDKLRYFRKVLEMSRVHEFEDKNPTYTWQYPVAEFWQIPFVIKKKGFAFEYGYDNHFKIGKQKLKKTLKQIEEEQALAEENRKYKPETVTENYFDDVDKQNKKEKQKDGENDPQVDGETSQSDEYFVAKKIQISKFEPQEDNFNHQNMENLDELLLRNKETGEESWTEDNSEESDQVDEYGNTLLFKKNRKKKTFVKLNDLEGSREDSARKTKNSFKSNSSLNKLKKKTMVSMKNTQLDEDEQELTEVFAKDKGRSTRKKLTEKQATKKLQKFLGNKSKNDTSQDSEKTELLKQEEQEESSEDEQLHPDIVYRLYAQEKVVRQGQKGYDDYRAYDENDDAVSKDSWASQNDWATLRRDYLNKKRENEGPYTPTIFQRSVDSFNRTEDLFFNQNLFPDYKQGELNKLWHDLFGDLTKEYKQEQLVNLQDVLEDDRRKMIQNPQIIPNLQLTIHFLKNFQRDKIKVRLSIVQGDATLSVAQKDILLHHELQGSWDQADGQTVLRVDFVTIFQIDLEHLKTFFYAEELMNMQLLITFYDKFGVQGWFFHPLYVQNDELLYQPPVKENRKNRKRHQQEDIAKEFLKPAYGNFTVNMFDPPMQKPPFTQYTRPSPFVFNYTLQHKNMPTQDIEKISVEKNVVPDDGRRFFVSLLELTDFKNPQKLPFNYEVEILNFTRNEVQEDRNGDDCRLENQVATPIQTDDKKINYFEDQIMFNVTQSDLVESQAKLNFKFIDSKTNKLVGSLVFDLVGVNQEVRQGEHFEPLFNEKGKKQSKKLKFIIEMAPFSDLLQQFDQLMGIQITMKKIGNYRQNYDVAYAVSVLKDEMLLADDNNDPIVFQSREFFPCDGKRQIKFNNQQLKIPLNPDKMRLQFYNNLFKLNLQFKFAVRLDDQNNQELLAWYAHPLFNANENEFNVGFYDVQLFDLPIVESDFYDTRYQRLPIRLQFKIDRCFINEVELLRMQESKESIFSAILLRQPVFKPDQQFSIIIHSVKNAPRLFNINFGILDPDYINDDTGIPCNFDAQPEDYDYDLKLLTYNTVINININVDEFKAINIRNLHNVHLFFVLRDIEDETVGYWVYISLFSKKLKFQTGDFREQLYAAPLVQPESLQEKADELILTDVEIAYTIQRSAFEELDDEYISEQDLLSNSEQIKQSGGNLSNQLDTVSSKSLNQRQKNSLQLSDSVLQGDNSNRRSASNQSELLPGDVRKNFSIKDYTRNLINKQRQELQEDSRKSSTVKQ